MHWIRVDRYSGAPSSPHGLPADPVRCETRRASRSALVAATIHDDESLNVMVYKSLHRTRYCSNNCPYKVRQFNFFNYGKDTPDILKLVRTDVTVRSRGVMESTYCTQRINAGS